ncbi:MAG: serine/threonine protein kinase [Candidatus Omnitrophota bacterium]|jgi:serine/threonine protein kinase
MSTSGISEISRGPGIGYRIGEYTIKGILGHGSMAEVYLAEDQTGHEIALKLFKEGPGVSETMLERFRREAEATKKLRRHPYILTVYNTGKEGDYHFIAMERISKSQTFEDMLVREKPRPRKLLHTIVKIAQALDYAHDHNIVHRDVKPSNIMIDEFGEPLLADFGVAELVDWPSCTVSGALTGTPMYMSPEQARAERVGPSTDVYSLAVVAYEGLTGQLPYDLGQGMNTANVLDAVKNQTPIRPRKFNKKISKDLEYVLLKALNKDPRDRYPSIKTFAQDLECVLEGRPVRARKLKPVYYIKYTARKHRSLLIVLTVIGGILGYLGYLYDRNMAEIRNEQVLSRAMIISKELQIGSMNLGVRKREDMSRSRVEIRDADKLMIAEDWDNAREKFENAASLSTVYRDARTSAMARLSQARCDLMLGDSESAIENFTSILANPDASPAIASKAIFGYVVTLVAQKDYGEAHALYDRYGANLILPYKDFVRCVLGKDLAVAELERQLSSFSVHFQNDAYLAIAIRSWVDGDPNQARKYLKECRRISVPKSDWPAPLAKHLYTQLGL